MCMRVHDIVCMSGFGVVTVVMCGRCDECMRWREVRLCEVSGEELTGRGEGDCEACVYVCVC